VCAALGIARTFAGDGVAMTGDPELIFTFDDGPNPKPTPAVLDTLAARGAQATFFLVGEQADRRPALVRELVAAGHEVALHGHRHRNLMRVGARALAADLDRGAAVVEDAAGVAVARHRPPYGIYTRTGLALVRARGWETVLWSRWGKDWRAFTTPQRITRRLTAAATAGDVLLLHDADYYSARGSWRHTAAALPRVLEELERRGLRATSLARPAGAASP
jgi:peptidoglycan/xylan/chitin deacetylase (PgdA/CDA1 family)